MHHPRILFATIAVIFAALFVSSPTPAKADEATAQAVAEWLFTPESLKEAVTVDNGTITINNREAKFNDDGKTFNITREFQSANINGNLNALEAPKKPLQITGAGRLNLSLGQLTVSGGALFSLNDEDSVVVVKGNSGCTIHTLAAEAGQLIAIDADIGELDISGTGKVTGSVMRMGNRGGVDDLIATNNNPETSFLINSPTVNNIYTSSDFKGVLKIGSTTNTVKQNSFSGGNIEINNASNIDFEAPINLSYTNDSAFPTLTVTNSTINSSGDFAAKVARGSLVLGEDATINGNVIVSDPMNDPYGNTLEFNGGKIDGNITIANSDLKFNATPEGEPAISGRLSIGDNTNIYVTADGGKITESSIRVGSRVNAYIQSSTEQVFTATGSGNIELSDSGDATIDSVSDDATVTAAGANVSVGDISGGTVTVNSGECTFTSEDGNTAGTININGMCAFGGSVYLNGTNLNINNYVTLEGGMNNQLILKAGEATIGSGASIINNGMSFFPTVELPEESSGKLIIQGTVSTVAPRDPAVKQAGGEIVVQDGGNLFRLEQSGGKTTVGNNNHASKISAAKVSGGELNVGLMGQVETLNSVTGGDVNFVGGDIGAISENSDDFSDGGINICAETLFNFPLNLKGTDLNVKQYTLHMMANKISAAGASAIAVTDGGTIEFMELASSPAIEVTGGAASFTLGDENGSTGNIKLVDSNATALGIFASSANLWAGSINGTPAIVQEMGDMNIGKAATEESVAIGPEIDGVVNIRMGEANILGGKIKGDLIVADTSRTKVTVGTAEHDGIEANGPTVTGAVPEPVPNHIVINYVNKEPEPSPEPDPEPEPEPQPEPQPPAPVIPSPDKVLSQVAPKIKETMADYASAEYSSDYLSWQLSIEDRETSVSLLAKDFVSELLQSLSKSTVKSAKLGDASISLPATEAKREAFANGVFGNAQGDKTLESLFGKTVQIDFTTSSGKVLTLTIMFSDAPSPEPEVVTIYRLYNPYLNGAHMLTLDANEFVTLKSLGWQDEGARFSEFKEAGADTVPVFRLYNPNNGDHFFTESENEAKVLESIGWTREGIAWYAPVESELSAYRLYNPYQTEYAGLGNHLWTVLENEAKTLEGLGWLGEDIGWYAMPLVAES